MNFKKNTTITIKTGKRTWNLKIIKNDSALLTVRAVRKDGKLGKLYRLVPMSKTLMADAPSRRKDGTKRLYAWTITAGLDACSDCLMGADEAFKAFPQMFTDLNYELYGDLTGLNVKHEWQSREWNPSLYGKGAEEVYEQGFWRGWFT